MNAVTFQELVQRNILPDDAGLYHEVAEAANLQNAFFVVVNFVKPGYEYVGPTCETVTGYSSESFLHGGPEFIFSIATHETALAIIQKQVAFSMEGKAPDFDPRNFRLHEYAVEFRSGFGNKKTLLTLGTPLSYTGEAEMEIGVAFHAEIRGDVVDHCKHILKRIKERHNAVYQHPSQLPQPERLKKVFVQKRPEQKLTPREEEVLRLIARGLTSAEIATALFIGENTVETHRKNLLSKFEAKNIAELIKKATKLYWLE